MCPLDQGEVVTFELNEPLRNILDDNPQGKVNFHLSIFDIDVNNGSEAEINCFTFNADVM